LAFYRDVPVLISASAVVTLDHALRGLFWPESVYGVLAVEPWRWVEHAGWVVFEDVFLAISIFQSRREMLEIAERQTRVETTNRELEAFSYSVSHDLRAPLRTMDGFADMLQTDHGDTLTADGMRCIAVIRESAQRMGALIDDLLAFSRLGREQIRPVDVDMHALVHETLAEQRAACAERVVELEVGEIRACRGDRALLKQVWTNLLSNAFKYTRRRHTARIVVGSMEDVAGNPIYFVRDNGTGFDMRYADKLFGVFQRLHRVKDFEGTGVGLAIVQRVVQRHGGRVWCDAEEGRGATFFFTVGAQALAVEDDPPAQPKSSAVSAA
jgi:light-regulated signal transduction histidine kinase (bacteriophytochrome)